MISIGLAATMMQTAGPFAGANWLTVPTPEGAIEKAKWIWIQRPEQTAFHPNGMPAETIHLHRTWTLAEKPLAATIKFTADNLSRIRINGREVARSREWRQFVSVDVTAALAKGQNTINVEATNGPSEGGNPSAPNPAGFLLASEARFADGRVERLLSDESWQSPEGRVTSVGDYGSSPWNLARPPVPAPTFRRKFQIAGNVKSAVARVIGLGHYDLFVNGRRQGDGLLNQPWSQYDKTLYWQEFDLAKGLRKGSNTIKVELGNSFYRIEKLSNGRFAKPDANTNFSGDAPYLLAMVLDVTYTDGRTERITTDKVWRWSGSPYALSHVYGGEDYDARREDPKWIANSGWHEPRIAPEPKAELRKKDWPAFRAIQKWSPTQIRSSKPGVWTYVFPQNAMAIVQFRVKGPRGATIKFKPSEVMTDGGVVEQLNLWGGESSCSYTLKGGAAESHAWRFFYHGFQFVEVTGAVPAGKPNPNGLPVLESLELVHVRTDNAQIGAFHSSNELFNRTHDLVDWAVRSNMTYYLSDCPHREKLGRLECAYLLFPTIAYRYDTHDWYRKIARDIRDIQLPDGRITTVAPDYLSAPLDNPFKFTIEWGAAGVFVPWYGHEWYGDRRFLTENYASMKGYVDWIADHASDGLAPQGLGDWYDYGHGQGPGPSRFTPTELTGTAMWAMCAEALAKAATALGRRADAARYRAMHAQIKASFLRHFYNPETKTFRNNGSVQSGHAMALCANLVPNQDRKAVLQGIIDDLEKRGYQQTPGDVGHVYFIRALAEAGRSDILHKVYNRTEVGSYGGILAKGLTTMPETWDAITVGSNSLNHCMLGHVMEWFYGWVLGIRQAPGSVGWKSILIAPEPGTTTSAKGETITPHGIVAVDWKKTGGRFQMKVTVPAASMATVVLPEGFRRLEIDGHAAKTSVGMFGRTIAKIGPGHHTILGHP